VAPSGDAFAFQTPQGVHVFRGVYTDPSRCGEAQENLVLPGASEPDWGPADVNPQPRAGGPPAGAPSGMPAGGKKGATGSPRISIPRASLATACRKGLRVALANVRSRKATIVVRRGGATVAKATVRVPKSGRGTFTVRFSKRAAKNPCKRPPRTVKLTVTAAGVEKAVTLAR
ncbi:MAG TPA: hypothetical protein VHA54_10660, partial [Solirubrobacterales bacterium]|nr:hypothetical protein [Solirubrobacterales bacterium]